MEYSYSFNNCFHIFLIKKSNNFNISKNNTINVEATKEVGVSK